MRNKLYTKDKFLLYKDGIKSWFIYKKINNYTYGSDGYMWENTEGFFDLEIENKDRLFKHDRYRNISKKKLESIIDYYFNPPRDEKK